MDRVLARTQRNFTIITISVAIFCSLVSTIGLYALAEHRLDTRINAAKIGALASENSELSKYIAEQEPNHAHFESIAAIIQREDRQQLNNLLPISFIFTLLISGLAGWALSRHLLRPVKESFVSQRRFMQDAAHELRNPLAAMQSLIQQALNKPPAKTGTTKLLNSIDRQANQLSAITTDLLLLERRDYAGKELINVYELLTDILEEMHFQSKKKQISLVLKVPKDFTARIDPQHFIYIAKNLIENAIKFSNKKQKIYITADKDGRGWYLEVKDKGIGIPSEDIHNITQRFYRARNAEPVDGTGLGMAIVYKFANIYQAKLEISSKLNKGTSIRVTF